MDRTPIESSNIQSAGYSPAEHRLQIEFKSGGVYDYEDVPPKVYEEFTEAPSKGRFFAQNIKGHFQCSRIGG